MERKTEGEIREQKKMFKGGRQERWEKRRQQGGVESSDQWKCRDREVQMERGNTDLYERSERTHWWNEQRDGWWRERKGGERRKGRIICDSVLLKPLAVY